MQVGELKRKIKENASIVVVYCIFLLVAINYFVTYISEIYIITYLIRVIIVICICVSMLLRKRIIIDVQTSILIVGLSITSILSSELDGVVFLILASVLIKNLDTGGVIIPISVIYFLMTGVLLIGLCLGIYTNSVDNAKNAMGVSAQLCGFNNANVAGAFFYAVLISIFLVSKNELKALAAVNIMNGVVFYLVRSRAPFLALIVTSLVFGLCIWNKNFSKLVAYSVVTFSFWAGFLSPLIYDRFQELNRFSSGRLGAYAEIMSNWQWSTLLFGGKPKEVESFFISFVGIHGLFLLLFLYILVIRRIQLLYKAELYKEIAFLTGFLLFGAFENVQGCFESLVSWVFWYCLLYAGTGGSKSIFARS